MPLVSSFLGAFINFRQPLANDLEPLKGSQSYEACMPGLVVVSCWPWNRDPVVDGASPEDSAFPWRCSPSIWQHM